MTRRGRRLSRSGLEAAAPAAAQTYERSDMTMTGYAIDSKPALVTGANRGLGRALVDELLERGCPRVYAAHRQGRKVPMEWISSPRVITGELDVTTTLGASNVARRIANVDELELGLLVNNAGVAPYGDVCDLPALREAFAVNVEGTARVTDALTDVMSAAGSAIVNIMTAWSFLNPGGPMAAYAASKAALHSLTQAWRNDFAGSRVSVHGVYAGPIATRMTEGLDIPKADPRVVARRVVDGVVAGDEYIYPTEDAAGLLGRTGHAGSRTR